KSGALTDLATPLHNLDVPHRHHLSDARRNLSLRFTTTATSARADDARSTWLSTLSSTAFRIALRLPSPHPLHVQARRRRTRTPRSRSSSHRRTARAIPALRRSVRRAVWRPLADRSSRK